jgi:putative hydrolase of the HAD superfamily
LTRFLDGIKAVFFDFENTLVYRTHSVSEVWLQVAGEQGVALREDALVEARAAADQIYDLKVYEFRGRLTELWDQYNSSVLRKLGITDTNGGMLRAITSAMLDTKWYRVFPETQPVLSTLRERGYQLGVIGNSTEGILERLKNLNLSQYLDTVVYSQEAGAEKPNPAPFKLALSRSGRSAKECIFVGDSLETDVPGARNVGIEPILIDRKGKYPNARCAVIRDLKDILD